MGPWGRHISERELLAVGFSGGQGAPPSGVGILFSSGEEMVSKAQRKNYCQALFPSHSWMGMGTAVLLLPSVRALCDHVSGAEGVILRVQH